MTNFFFTYRFEKSWLYATEEIFLANSDIMGAMHRKIIYLVNDENDCWTLIQESSVATSNIYRYQTGLKCLFPYSKYLEHIALVFNFHIFICCGSDE